MAHFHHNDGDSPIIVICIIADGKLHIEKVKTKQTALIEKIEN